MGNDNGTDDESDDESDKQAVNIENPSLTVSNVERIEEQGDEASDSLSELPERIYQGSWDFEQEINRRATERLAGLGVEVRLEQEKAAKMAILADEWSATVQDYTQ